jgi:hypothetical protein
MEFTTTNTKQQCLPALFMCDLQCYFNVLGEVNVAGEYDA